MPRPFSLIASIALLWSALLWSVGALAQDEEANGEEDEDALETIEDFADGFDVEDGLFPLYRDMDTGHLYMEIGPRHLSEEFIYFVYGENGAPDLDLFRGAFRENRVITFKKRFDVIEIAAENTSFYFDPDNALHRAKDANITRAPLSAAPIEAATGEGEEARYLISASDILLTEALHQVTPWSSPDASPGDDFALGDLSEDKTWIVDVRGYDKNTDVVVEYVFDDPAPTHYGGADITDPRAVAVKVQHSFIAMPEPGYEPRADDFRVGYFRDAATDLTSTSYTPYADVITRWRLEKENPDAPLSDPVTPITWWIENTTPVEYRDIIRDAALAWNVAFEAAGFTNAIEVKVQPEKPDWEAGDIERNVMRWTSSPNPPFGGYGPSFTNPRTGEIIGADIMLEFVYLTNRLKYDDIFAAAALPAADERRPAFRAPPRFDPRLCQAGANLQHQVMLGAAVLRAQGRGEAAVGELVEQALYELVLHEIGHTLGLMHNMRASATVPLDELHDERPAVGSVMDYSAVNLAPLGGDQGAYYLGTPGPYDVWAIEFGYTPSLDDPDAEKARVEALLARSTDPALAFGNDADDMRAPGRHIDPRVMINDLSDDPIAWADERIALIDDTLEKLPDTYQEDGESYDGLRTAYFILTAQRLQAATAASRFIGGVYNNRALIGQAGAETPFAPVPAETQKAALDLLADHVFAPGAFTAGEALAARLQRKRRGFDHFGENEDPRLHQRAQRMQGAILAHLLHPAVLTRMTDARRYGGNYPVADYLGDLTGAVFDADIGGDVDTYRQNLQIDYVKRLIAVAEGDGPGSRATPGGPTDPARFDWVARSAARASLMDIQAMVKPGLFGEPGDRETKAHRAHIRALIADFEDA
ncbi:MAG: zinc-dependent metalloprotease [Caulobacterales bacterium]|nr:zinc-dependent metalloprotease [Caulobacterales bacterium]